MQSQNFNVELREWIKEFPYWKQYLACKILRRQGFTDLIVNNAFQYFLQEHSLNERGVFLEEEDLTEILEGIVGKHTEAATKNIQLSSITDFKAISALQEGQQISLSPHLTVLFGENGAGKSSYVRLFNNAFASRGDTEILPNIYVEGEYREPSCLFEFELEGNKYCIRYPNDKDRGEFTLFTVFDSKSVRVHLDEKNEFLFTPSGFEFFNHFIKGLDRLGERLNEAQRERRQENPFRSKFPLGRPVGNFMHQLTLQSSFQELEELAKFTSEDENRLRQYEKRRAQLLALEIEEKIEEELNFRRVLKEFRSQVISLELALSDEQIKTVNLAINSVVEKHQLAEGSGEEQFRKLGQQYAGTDEWKAFITAAFVFADKLENTYPNEQSHCVFCGQPLEKDAIELVKNYRVFLTSTIEEDLRQAEIHLNELAERLRNLTFPSLSESSYLYHKLNSIKENQIDLEHWKSQLEAIEDAKNNLLVDIEQLHLFQGDIPSFDLTSLDRVIERVDKQLKKLTEQDPAKKIKELEVNMAALTDKQALNEILPEVKKYLNDLRWISKASSVSHLFNTHGTTRKQRTFFEKYVAGDYLDIFQKECENLKASFDVEVIQQGRKGNTLRELKIKGHNLARVLSEGEQRAISLADFLTEIQVSSVNKGIMFDDPVNSLDHIRKKCIAERLAKEALKRQVVIFTHDLMFLSYIKEAAQTSQTGFKCHWIQKTQDGAGLVFLDNSPSNESDYKKTGVARKYYERAKIAGPEEQEQYLRQGFGALRTNYEAFVVFELFNGVVLRFDERISIGRLEEVQMDREIIRQVIDKSGELSRYIEGHLHSDRYVHNKPTPKLLFEEIEAFEAMKKRHRDLRNQAKK